MWSNVRGCSMYGTWFHAPRANEIEVLSKAVVNVDLEGVIESVLQEGEAGYEEAKSKANIDASEGGRYYMLPGFVDLHVHAPQYPQLGLALDEPVEVWLHKYTFPLEACYSAMGETKAQDQEQFGRMRYESLVRDLLANGTTTALYFATVELASSKLLATVCMELKQRALVGKVVMDNAENCPSYYRDISAADSVKQTRELIEYLRGHSLNNEHRVLPVITPRFVPSCSDAALQGLGKLASETQCHIQTHCSESDWAHEYALKRFGETDTRALDRFGLLTRRSVLAHANFITADDMQVLREKQSAVAHCPVSNAYFAGSVFPLRRALENAISVGLGTDISGGPILSMFDAIRHTVQSSRMLETGVDSSKKRVTRGVPGSAVNLATAFHLATVGGGRALDLPIGQIAKGYRFDVILIDAWTADGGIRLFDEKREQAIIAKILYSANRANVAAVWVDGLLASSKQIERARL